MLKVLDIVIDVKETVGCVFLLVDITPVYAYKEGGEKTDVIVGYYYTCVLPEKNYRRLKVKVLGKQMVDKNECPAQVAFTDLKIKLYTRKDQYQLAASAIGIQKA
jgi:hypothetical protein